MEMTPETAAQSTAGAAPPEHSVRSPGQMLRPFAVSVFNTRGRRADISPSHDRSPFRRDYARLVHSRWFRAMQGKQVLPFVPSPFPRTLASTAIEVEQVVRAVCHRLRLNEDLAATMAIASNIGLAPCGERGGIALVTLASAHGGLFSPARQALRMVDVLDDSYVEHAGLNLLYETREFLARRDQLRSPSTVPPAFSSPGSLPLEGQVVSSVEPVIVALDSVEGLVDAGLADARAVLEQPALAAAHAALMDIPRFRDIARASPQGLPVSQVIRMAFSMAVADIVATSAVAIERSRVETLDEVRAAPPLVGQSESMSAQYASLATALCGWLSAAPRSSEPVESRISDLFLASLPANAAPVEACQAAIDAVVTTPDAAFAVPAYHPHRTHRRPDSP